MFKGNCQTTAMGILPHRDVDQALDLACSLDIPFWPQLPRVSFFEDMYAQVSEHFPGIISYPEEGRLELSMNVFVHDLEEYVANWENIDYFRLSSHYSQVYHRFLQRDLTTYSAIRGQSIGPISFGLKITDATKTPIIYHDEVRGIIFPFIANKLRAQYEDLVKKNPQAFVWVDEPGLEMLFMAFTGYTSEKAAIDYANFLQELPGPKAVHLCGNPDWSFLLQLDLDILSLDALQCGHIFTRYTTEVKSFLKRGGIISWGITPTMTEELSETDVAATVRSLEDLWSFLVDKGIPRDQILAQAWLAPARCCLVNADGAATVEKSFALLREVSRTLRQRYSLA